MLAPGELRNSFFTREAGYDVVHCRCVVVVVLAAAVVVVVVTGGTCPMSMPTHVLI